MDLRTALANIHRDPLWRRKILIGGALMLTLGGYPWAVGLVMESLDNSRKGYPTPLPPWRGWSTRYLIGLFALLIDFAFFVLPLLVLLLIFVCVLLATTLGGGGRSVGWIGQAAALIALTYELVMFAFGIAPIARLIYADEGGAENAISIRALREALRPGARRIYARARLHSLPAYLPMLTFGLALVAVARSASGIALPITLILLWLTFSALLYAHLAVVQIYAGAERAARAAGGDRITG